MPRALTQCRGTALTELEEVGGAQLMWCVAAALKNEIVNKEKQKKKHLHGWGVDNRGQRLGVTYGRYVLAFRGNPKRRLKGFLYLER